MRNFLLLTSILLNFSILSPTHCNHIKMNKSDRCEGYVSRDGCYFHIGQFYKQCAVYVLPCGVTNCFEISSTTNNTPPPIYPSDITLSQSQLWNFLGSFNFWVCEWNPIVWPFVWNLFSSTFIRYYLLFIILQNESWYFSWFLVLDSLGS